MWTKVFSCIAAACVLVSLAVGTISQTTRPSPASQTGEVTIKGNVLCNRATATKPWTFDPKDGDHTPVVFAIDGTVGIKATLAEVIDKHYPKDGLDADAAVKLLDQFSERLKYHIAPGPTADAIHKEVEWGSRAFALTGTTWEKDGLKWIAVTKYEPTKLDYPATMLAPDKPFAPAGEDMLTLKFTDTLALNCVLLPAGEFLQGTPFYQFPRWQDEYPHLVTLTRPFYMSEHPITQEMFEAVIGSNPSRTKDPKLPVQNVPYADMQKFCRTLSEKTGQTVRLPTDAEWEYAARAGTSNPSFREKYNEQASVDSSGKLPLPVKSKQANAWGLYDMVSPWYEVVSDPKADNARTALTDPGLPKPADRYDATARTRKDKGGGADFAQGGQSYSLGTHGAVEPNGVGQEGSTKFRIVVEVTAETATTKP